MLAPLAPVAAVFCVRKVPVVVLLVTGVYLASVVLVFVTARYRVAVVPLLAVLAAGGAVAIGPMLRARRWRRLGTAAGCFAATVLAGTVPGPLAAETMD